MRLLDIYANDMEARKVCEFLYEMLKDRVPVVNISHRKMPSLQKHISFVASRPYAAWYIIDHNGEWFGNCYLTRADEIGIHLIPKAQRRGIGSWAVKELMKRHGKRRYFANIAPLNIGSQNFFRSLGFKISQFTYEFEHAGD